MALSRIKTFSAGEVLTAADLNAEFNNPLNNALSLISPLTGNLDVSSNSLQNVNQIDIEGHIVFEVGSDPTVSANTGAIYTKDVSSKAELHWRDEDANIVQITSAGKINNSAIDPIFDRDHIGGLKLTNNGTDADHDIDFAVGECRDDADTENLALSSSITKRLDASWAVGTNAGGLDTGTVAGSTLYAVWLIKRTDTGVVDALFSASFSSPTMPTNYDKKRLIGAVLTDGSANVLAFTQSGNYFRYDAPQRDVNDNGITPDTYADGTLSVPPNCLGHVYINASDTSGNSGMRVNLRTKGAGDGADDEHSWSTARTVSAGDMNEVGGIGSVLVDSSSQVQYASRESGTTTIVIRTIGFDMLTRENP